MYDIRQFRPTLYLLLLVGISGFALAAQSPGLWLIGAGGIVLNAMLMWTGLFRPLPRVLANLITLAATLYIMHELVTSGVTPVMVIGQFLVFLQLVKLWEQRANRDYAQLLVLSLLLMVAASINTVSLWFGLLLILYLFLSLYCCLLFHLKVETDGVKSALAVPPDKLSPTTLRQDQRHLARSMRKLTFLVCGIAVTFAVFVFLFFPRGSGAGIFGPLQLRGSAALTGFSEQVSFQEVARITQNHEKVAYVRVWHNEQPVDGDRTILLRGVTLDTYRKPVRPGLPWEWTRSSSGSEMREVFGGRSEQLEGVGNDQWRQRIILLPTRTNVLFAMGGPTRFTPADPIIKLKYTPADGVLETLDVPTEKVNYEVISSNQIDPPPQNPYSVGKPAARAAAAFPRIFDFAKRPEVCGSDAQGSLGEQRAQQSPDQASPLDEEIARNIERYLRDNFTYTLDLTDERSVRNRDPLEAFLYDWKRGHCEYFAGAMTLMCQSLGMQARMVVGFKCGPEEYNEYNKQYIVLQSDAHAWVEVRTASGWKVYDPTSSRESNAGTGNGLKARLGHLIDFLEYTYANAIIAYDLSSQENVRTGLGAAIRNTGERVSGIPNQIAQFMQSSKLDPIWGIGTIVLTGILLLMIGIVAAAVGWFIWERWRLRRRAIRIGIESLPDDEQLRLARQLGFYDDLLRLLDHHHIVRPAHLTPLEFSRSLAFLPSDAYDTIQRLTGLFYRVRFGRAELTEPQRRRLSSVISRLSFELSDAMPAMS
jgi:transglutaminase-like putative cysteine protease